MSNARKKKFSIEPVNITEKDQSVMKGLLGRMLHKNEDGNSPAGTSLSAQLPSENKDNATKPDSSHSRASSPSSPSPATLPDQPTLYPAAPEKNFQKVTNTITKEAIPQGYFKQGKAKQLYDVLYSLTRGAIVPQRTVQISKPKLRTLSDIGAKTTMNACLESLEQVGLIRITTTQGGTYDGNLYEVFLPEEISLPSPASPPSRPSGASPGLKVVGLGGLESRQPSPPLESINIGGLEQSKTLYKTNSILFDDEKALDKIFKELAGAGYTPNEKHLNQIIELLAAELREAAARTKMVTDPAAFLLTHLRRRLGVRAVTIETKAGASKSAPARTQEIKLTDDEIQECPDCKGRLVIYPEGQGRGAIVCRHPELIKAKSKKS